MGDIQDLLDEAVGTHEPRGSQRAVEELVERRRRRRRFGAGSVAVVIFALGGWLAWAAFRPGESTVGSSDASNYVLSGFEVTAAVDRTTDEVDPTRALVRFDARWSSDAYPGDHQCAVHVFDMTGAEVGSQSFGLTSQLATSHHSIDVPVTRPTVEASASGTCAPERLDTPVAYEVSDVRLEEGFTVSYVIRWPKNLGEGQYPSNNACTVALFENANLVAQRHRSVGAPDGQELTETFERFNHQPILMPPGLEATVACQPWVQDGVYPQPQPPMARSEPPEGEAVLVPNVIALTRNEAVMMLEELGLTVTVAITPSNDTAEGMALSQDPAPGTSVDPGTTVTVTVSGGPTLPKVLRVSCPDDGPPTVGTPDVVAQRDGLHVRVIGTSATSYVLLRQPLRPGTAWSSGSYGLDDEFVLPVPPGETFIACLGDQDVQTQTPAGSMQPDEASFEVVDDGTWVSMDLGCGFDEQSGFSVPGTSNAGLDPIEAVRGLLPGVLTDDRVEHAGYPAWRERTYIRVVREGVVVAWVSAVHRGDGIWHFLGYACQGSGIGG